MTEQEQNQLRKAMNADNYELAAEQELMQQLFPFAGDGGHGRIDLFSRRYQKHPRTGDSLHSV